MSCAPPPSLFTVVVVGAIGTTNALLKGSIISIGIKPPSAAAIYSFDCTDAAGFGVAAIQAAQGTVTFPITNQGIDISVITISGASVDGTYLVKVWYGSD